MLGINAVIGAGIFLTPGAVIKLAGPLAPVAYILAGLFAGIMALVFATAARYVKTNGASYAYTTAAFGQTDRHLRRCHPCDRRVHRVGRAGVAVRRDATESSFPAT